MLHFTCREPREIVNAESVSASFDSFHSATTARVPSDICTTAQIEQFSTHSAIATPSMKSTSLADQPHEKSAVNPQRIAYSKSSPNCTHATHVIEVQHCYAHQAKRIAGQNRLPFRWRTTESTAPITAAQPSSFVLSVIRAFGCTNSINSHSF